MKFYTNCALQRGKVLLRGYEDGERIQREVYYSPYVFTSTNKKSPYKTIEGKNVEKKVFENFQEAREYLNKYQDVSGLQVYGHEAFLYTFLYDNYPGQIRFDKDEINIVNIDIEIAADQGFPSIELADKPITAITVFFKGIYYVYGIAPYETTRDDVRYYNCETEFNLIMQFLDDWQKFDPDIITGWNVEEFDIPYLINRFTNMLGPDTACRMSPWKQIYEKNIFKAGQEKTLKSPLGVTVLDYLALYRKFTYTMQESYRLDHIAFVELGDRKLDYSEHGSLLELYKHDYQKFIDYNIKDVEIVQRLDDKLGLIDLVFALAYDAKVNYIDALTSVKMWDIIIHNYLMDKNIVVPRKTNSRGKERQIVGAYVKDPQVGMHEWVCSFDLNSLYPHLIMQYNISPDTFAGHIGISVSVDDIINGGFKSSVVQDKILNENVAVAATGFTFTKNKRGFLPELMDKMYQDRKAYKGKMIEAKKENEVNPSNELEREIARLDNMQMAKKIQLNSAYGALGNDYFRWYDIKYAESITTSGQLSIRWIEKKINEYLNKLLKTDNKDYVIASDTDSIYVNMDRLVKHAYEDASSVSKDKIVTFLDKVCRDKIEPYIDKCYQELADYVGAYDQKMKMKRECIADKGIWTAKKRYILNVYDNEGVRYAEPKLKMMGIEAVRSSTPSACRDEIKSTLRVIMDTDEPTVQAHIQDFRERHKQMSFEDVAFPRSVRNLEKYKDSASLYKKGTPIHVRGTLIYNKMLEDKQLTKRYESIYNGDKIKFCYMKLPNPFHENVLATTGSLPVELDLDDYIDYELQFSKGYLEPIKTILDAVGWKTERIATLEDFFI